MKSNNTKLRRTICFAAAATLVQSSQVNAFTQPDQCKVVNNNIFQHTPQKASEKNDINTSITALSDQVSQHDALPLFKADSELTEFLDRKLNPGGGLFSLDNSETDLPLFKTLTDEQREFELMLGKALDTLRSDYPDMLTKDPDFSIYHSQIEAVDPKGITLHTLNSYKTSFQFLHMIINLFYSPDDSSLTFRLVYDCARKSIRVSWNAILIPRMGGVSKRLHVDGISVYEFERKSGLINQHRVEHLLINDAPVEAPQGIFSAIKNHAMAGPDADGIPVWSIDGKITNVMEFKQSPKMIGMGMSSLFSSSETTADGDFQHPLFDRKAFNSKNASRKKFGIPPLTPDEFVKIQAEVKAMETVQEQKQKTANKDAEDAKEKENQRSLLSKMFGNVMKNTCESNDECERPEVCCDLGFKKFCCSSGMRVFDVPPNLQKIPIRVIADDGRLTPRGGPDGMDRDYY